ncbi:hypothetical protein [Propionivibrio dicarboxylicus]|uniref:Uncharacterized protein n=1 Tax=Propionivibrio dicarboxylicus TaxID=83767 RepID=A0A1G8HX29_9RHOO|nr:hypothetical protein [Propionivibrio dicarboxylicus]SDI11122.1 hypothetical protein SAMN05660652_02867 [Propionivibrio dicarboxylicus]
MMPASDDERMSGGVAESLPGAIERETPASAPASDEWTGCTGQCARCRYREPCEAGVPIEPGR